MKAAMILLLVIVCHGQDLTIKLDRLFSVKAGFGLSYVKFDIPDEYAKMEEFSNGKNEPSGIAFTPKIGLWIEPGYNLSAGISVSKKLPAGSNWHGGISDYSQYPDELAFTYTKITEFGSTLDLDINYTMLPQIF
jgi:hypothetical protein